MKSLSALSAVEFQEELDSVRDDPLVKILEELNNMGSDGSIKNEGSGYAIDLNPISI